jgi:polar amino acid transport system substrate-binding protein
MQSFSKLLVLVLMLAGINVTNADVPFIIVTDPWPPYVYMHNGKPAGLDAEIALSVLKELGIEGKIEMMPWKRSLLHVKAKKADAILSAAPTAYRRSFLHFPIEPLSSASTVFFMRDNDEIKFQNLSDLESLKVAAMLGYKYCPELDNTKLLLSASRVATLEQSFNMLTNKHVDLVAEVDLVGLFTAREMGISDTTKILNGSRFCSVDNYLAFARKAGYEIIAKKFGEALIKFKKTPAYKSILIKYGMNN